MTAESGAGAETPPPFYMEHKSTGRKPKDIIVFRVQGLAPRDIMTWRLQRNERLIGNIIEQRFEREHCKILYMLSYYGIVARSADVMESWMRHNPFNVLIYEAIVKTCLDLDYAPISVVVCADGAVRRLFMNISQEGQSLIDDLREGGHISGLKVQTKEAINQTMFQVSARGLELLEVMPQEWKTDVDRFLFSYESCPYVVGEEPDAVARDPEAQVQVCFENGTFVLYNQRGLRRESRVTDTEDVSYCSSPYLPDCLRGAVTKPFKSNAYRASECRAKAGSGSSDVADALDEILALDQCTIMVVEYIPFGTNQLVGLNERLGALDRCQGGFFTNQQDASPTDTKFNIPVGMTDVVILEFDVTHYINFEAHIQFPETDDIVQVEEFGMHLNVDGTVLYGLRVEAIDDSLHDNVSVDKLSRMLVDVHQDSTRILDDMLTPYQRNLMDIVFNNDTENRGKYNVIVADAIKPANGQAASFDYLSAQDYMDRGEVENELRQVVNEIESCTLVNGRNLLILGRGGCIFAGPDAHKHEEDLILFSRLLVREKFLGYFFARTFALDNALERIGQLIVDYYKDPHHVQEGRRLVTSTSRVVILMVELLGYIDDSLLEIQHAFFHHDAARPTDPAKLELTRLLDSAARLQTLKYRCRDLKKLLTGLDHSIGILQGQLGTVAAMQSELVVRSIDANFKQLVAACAAQERAAVSSKVMETIFSSGLFMRLIDRLVGESMTGNTGPLGHAHWIDHYVKGWLVWRYPGLFWCSVMAWTGGLLYALNLFMRHLLDQALDARSVMYTIDQPIHVQALESLCHTRAPAYVDHVIERCTRFHPGRHLVKVAVKELSQADRAIWPGEPPRVVLSYNQTNGYLLKARLEWNNRRLRIPSAKVFEIFNEWLHRRGVYVEGRWWAAKQPGCGGLSEVEGMQGAVKLLKGDQAIHEGPGRHPLPEQASKAQEDAEVHLVVKAPPSGEFLKKESSSGSNKVLPFSAPY